MSEECNTDVNAARLDVLERDVNELYGTVYKGNGHDSVVTQLTSLNARLDSCNRKIDENIQKADARWEAKMDSFAEKNQLKIDHLNENINSRLGRIESSLTSRLESLELLLKAYNADNVGKREITWKSVTIIAGICTVLVSGLLSVIVKLISE